jgi:hypothetical protein
MEIPEILDSLERIVAPFPREAVEAAVARREEITPYLLDIVEDTTARAAELADDHDYSAHVYAMFLLAQFRETRAYAPILRYAALPGELIEDLGDEFVTSYLGRVLASVSGGDAAGIHALIENGEVNPWVRGAALDGLVTLVATGQTSRDETVTYLAELFRGKLPREHNPIWSNLVATAALLYPGELLADIRRANDEGMVEEYFIAWDDVERPMSAGKDATMAELAGNWAYRWIDDTAGEMGGWGCFQEEDNKPFGKDKIVRAIPVEEVLDDPEPPDYEPVETFQREGPKIGRNDPCPCGSGKKYKRCCGA